MPLIEKVFNSDIARLLAEIDPALVPFSPSLMKLGEVKDFSSLAIASQAQGTPLKDAYTGSSEAQQKDAENAFIAIATSILEKTNGFSK